MPTRRYPSPTPLDLSCVSVFYSQLAFRELNRCQAGKTSVVKGDSRRGSWTREFVGKEKVAKWIIQMKGDAQMHLKRRKYGYSAKSFEFCIVFTIWLIWNKIFKSSPRHSTSDRRMLNLRARARVADQTPGMRSPLWMDSAAFPLPDGR